MSPLLWIIFMYKNSKDPVEAIAQWMRLANESHRLINDYKQVNHKLQMRIRRNCISFSASSLFLSRSLSFSVSCFLFVRSHPTNDKCFDCRNQVCVTRWCKEWSRILEWNSNRTTSSDFKPFCLPPFAPLRNLWLEWFHRQSGKQLNIIQSQSLLSRTPQLFERDWNFDIRESLFFSNSLIYLLPFAAIFGG